MTETGRTWDWMIKIEIMVFIFDVVYDLFFSDEFDISMQYSENSINSNTDTSKWAKQLSVCTFFNILIQIFQFCSKRNPTSNTRYPLSLIIFLDII